MASAKCLMGKKPASVRTQASSTGMKMSEMNRSGKIDMFTTAGAASAFGTTDVIAMPNAQKVAEPTRIVIRKAGIFSVVIVTS
jgi:hypothetical protein